jgi:predicted Zn-ribbon and HTH transcriptional regulator
MRLAEVEVEVVVADQRRAGKAVPGLRNLARCRWDRDDTLAVRSDTCRNCGSTFDHGASRRTPRAQRTKGTGRLSTIADWLRSIGLPQYVPLFEQHRIDLDVVTKLTDEDLREVEIPLGDRKRLLKAISAFADITSTDSRAVQMGAAAERRQITVVFCDLAGSTQLASRLDPEDLAATMSSYHDCCKEVIDRWDGHVAEFLGDGAVIYFGWPTAHEDDAERAVRAALELVASVGRLPVTTIIGRTARLLSAHRSRQAEARLRSEGRPIRS